MNEFVVITEIFYKNEKISRRRLEKSELSKEERNQLIQTLFYHKYGKMNVMDIYSFICINLKEQYHIQVSERSVMRAIKKKK
jgi:hypothetical protein